MPSIAVLDDPAVAAAALDPLRSRLLHLLADEPASAAGLAAAVDIPRQKVTYHLKALAERGLVHEVAQRRHGGIVERLYRASAAAYLVSPDALGPAAAAPERVADGLSATYLLALAGRAVREVGILVSRAAAADRRLATLSIDSDVCFATPAARAAFTAELADAIATLVARHHDESTPDGRWHRLVVLAHPTPEETP